MKRSVLVTIAGIVLLFVLVFYSPFERQSGEFSQVLQSMGQHQKETSDVLTEQALEQVEGTVVGEHQVDGSNWSIPNIIRHVLGVD